MTKLTHGTWVIVADGEKALIAVNATDGDDPFLTVLKVEEIDNPPMREQAAARPGRFSDGPSMHRSAVEEADWHELGKARFAADLADKLYSSAHKGAFDKLVLVAPPKTLGRLRDALHAEVQQRVIAEIGKDLTNHPMTEIEKMLKAELKTL